MKNFFINRSLKHQTFPIFTFWEPAGKMYPYLSACMSTWGSIQNAQIIILDYNSIKEHTKIKLPDNTFKLPLPQQADIIRMAVLISNQGVWMDADMLVTANTDAVFEEAFSHGISLFGNPGKNAFNNFICTSNPDNDFLGGCLDEILDKISKPLPAQIKWDYAAGPFYEAIKRDMHGEQNVGILDYRAHKYIAEVSFGPGYGVQPYKDFWFSNPTFDPNILSQSSGLICLHNSWTPQDFKKKTFSEIVASNEPLANCLKYYANDFLTK
ncbi:glycosyltransferase [Agrobacterium sp. BA1120]|uniref:glycosyltransferase n=1 Tax=Agrobacterium sp. BA1120 TaxID=3228927 RepID=UPI003369F340